ncbi:MAG: FmdB family zinc ribbon protein [bacterium]
MPIFEYQCKKCQFKFEKILLSSNEKINIFCPKCKDENITKLFSIFGFNSAKNFTSSSSSGCNTCATKKCSSCKT